MIHVPAFEHLYCLLNMVMQSCSRRTAYSESVLTEVSVDDNLKPEAGNSCGRWVKQWHPTRRGHSCGMAPAVASGVRNPCNVDSERNIMA